MLARVDSHCHLWRLDRGGYGWLDPANEVLAPIVADLLSWFGPDRLMWGSDWPVLTLADTYSGWADLTERLLSELSQSEQAATYGGTAQQFYGVAAA